MTHDDASRIRTDDQTLDDLAAGYRPTATDEKLVQYAAAYRDCERDKAMQTLSQLYTDSQRIQRLQQTRRNAQRVLFVVVIVAAILGLFTGMLALTLVAAGALLVAWVVGGFTPAR